MANMRSWKNNLQNMINDIVADSDHPDCPKCGARMNFYGHDENGDFPLGEGYWECPDCGFSITENEL